MKVGKKIIKIVLLIVSFAGYLVSIFTLPSYYVKMDAGWDVRYEIVVALFFMCVFWLLVKPKRCKRQMIRLVMQGGLLALSHAGAIFATLCYLYWAYHFSQILGTIALFTGIFLYGWVCYYFQKLVLHRVYHRDTKIVVRFALAFISFFYHATYTYLIYTYLVTPSEGILDMLSEFFGISFIIFYTMVFLIGQYIVCEMLVGRVAVDNNKK